MQHWIARTGLAALLTLAAALTSLPAETKEAPADAGKGTYTPIKAPTYDWVAPMKAVHAKFKGQQGTFAHFGDSITVTMAFWMGLQWKIKNADAETLADQELVKGYMDKKCWKDWKGPKFGNNGRMTIRWAHQNIDTWLKSMNPEVALIMFGTNDLGQLKADEYETKTREVVQKCLDNGTVVILSTIPPRHGKDEKCKAFAAIVRKIAEEKKVLLEDFHNEVMKRRPDDWNGKLEKFGQYKGYEVPTLIARDGVHPSNFKAHRSDFSEAGLKTNGFTLRNYLVLKDYAQVIKKVLK